MGYSYGGPVTTKGDLQKKIHCCHCHEGSQFLDFGTTFPDQKILYNFKATDHIPTKFL